MHPQELLRAGAERAGRARARSTRARSTTWSSAASRRWASRARTSRATPCWPRAGPIEVTGVSLNRFCGSGLQAVHFGGDGRRRRARRTWSSAGGVESMSRVPMGSDGGGQDGNNLQLRKRVFQVPQGISADLIATLEGFTRARARRGRARVAEERGARDRGEPLRPLARRRARPGDGALALERDEFAAAGHHADGPGAARAGVRRAGRDGRGPTAARRSISSRWRRYRGRGRIQPPAHRRQLERHRRRRGGGGPGVRALRAASTGVKPRARIRAMATLGSEPVIMLTAPAPASREGAARWPG